MTTNGKVFLVGAGPGDPDLLTLKAVQALALADVVLLDDLVNPDILKHCPQARIVPVGKRGGCTSTPQHFIQRMMIAFAAQGQCVVRLKGGDAFVFGRGGEEMMALRDAHIPYEIIPGITSGLAACASVELPVTHRAFNHGVTLLTGHTQEGHALPWRALVESQTTLVIYMGMQQIAQITEGLLTAGMRADMPCMVIENGTRANERAALTNLSCLDLCCAQQQFASPAIIVIGEVATLASTQPSSAWPWMPSLTGLPNAA